MMENLQKTFQKTQCLWIALFFGLAFVPIAMAQPGKDGVRTISTSNTIVNRYTRVVADVPSGSTTITVQNINELASTGAGVSYINATNFDDPSTFINPDVPASVLGDFYASNPISTGDLIMLYQAQGAIIDVTNTSNYGSVTDLNNAGQYEFFYVSSVSGNVITLTCPAKNSYFAQQYVQVIRVPQFTTLTLNAGASVSAVPWGSPTFGGSNASDIQRRRGGVVVIHATDIVNNGTIEVNGDGFRGGTRENFTSSAGATVYGDYVTTDARISAEKGESIAGYRVDYGPSTGGVTDIGVVSVTGSGVAGRYGRGAPANGGGGGNAHNAGGGGGANASNGNTWNGLGIMNDFAGTCGSPGAWALDPDYIAVFPGKPANTLSNSSGGGRGGYTFAFSNQDACMLPPSSSAWAGDRRDAVGGIGGRPIPYNNNERFIYFGGGGGAGDGNNQANNDGGDGGGIVYLVVTGNLSGTGTISARGETAPNTRPNHNDAPGGGGGGGAVVVKTNAMSGSLTFDASGGNGGNQLITNNESEGPGGGGGGGYIAISPISASPTRIANGGSNGRTNSAAVTEFRANGATSGAQGQPNAVITTDFIKFSVCVTKDTDTDGIDDSVDIDDDNDGIRDVDEDGVTGGTDPSADADSDGNPNFSDPDFPGFVDSNADGINDNFDKDLDSVPNHLDLDSDNDGINDIRERGGASVTNTGVVTGVVGANGFLDALETAVDNGVPNYTLLNTDGDGVTNFLDLDSDNDGINDVREYITNTATTLDANNDGLADGTDTDKDGILSSADDNTTTRGETADVAPHNTDGDSVPDYIDLDSDNDAINDVREHTSSAINLDTDNDGLADGTDTDNDGIRSSADNSPNFGDANDTPPHNTDFSSEGVTKIPDYRDLDSDNDAINDVREYNPNGNNLTGLDPNCDGLTGALAEGDNDGDGIRDNADAFNGFGETTDAPPHNTDGDAVPDYRDLDSDNDGINDAREYIFAVGTPDTDVNGDGIIGDNVTTDTDLDGILELTIAGINIDTNTSSFGENDNSDTNPANTDGTGDGGGAEATTLIPDYRDLDSDNDGINDVREYANNTSNFDTDNNGLADGTDLDNDGILSSVDGNLTGFGDTSDPLPHNTDNTTEATAAKIPDYRDLDSDNDGINDVREYAPNTLNLDVDNNATAGNNYAEGTDVDGIVTAADDANTTFGETADVPPINTDGDLLPDYRDLDSDNDGINDVIEYRASGENYDGTLADGIIGDAATVTDGDNDGIPNFDPDGAGPLSDNDGTTGTRGESDNDFVPINTDGASVASDTAPDYRDLDSDNDSVNDVVEYRDANGNTIIDGLETNLDLNADGLVDGNDADSDGILSLADGSVTYADASDPLPVDTDGTGGPNYRDLDADNNGTFDITQNGNGAFDSNNNGVVDTAGDTDIDGILDVVDGSPLYGDAEDKDLDGIPNATDLDDDNDGIPDTVEGAGDADSDGIPNSLDLDSDNDGIADVVEAGGVDDNADGIADFTGPLGTAVGANGLMDNLENFSAGSSELTNNAYGTYYNPLATPASQLAIDRDADGVPDFLDLDSDNDGIFDTKEAYGIDANNDGIHDFTGTFANNDLNKNGWLDKLEVVLGGSVLVKTTGTPGSTPTAYVGGNADNDILPNFRDLDSDNDGINDTREATFTGLDTDNNGLTGNGIPTVNAAGVATSGTVTSDILDTDGDSKPDYIDLDSDNDGINDLREYFPSTIDNDPDPDGDGMIAIASATDSDFDGIKDVTIGGFAFDNNVGGFADTGDQAPVNTDNNAEGVDKIPDYRDLDSDNDGINDVREYFATTITADPDANNDGIVGGAGATDTDGDGIINVTIGAINVDNFVGFGDNTDPLPANTDQSAEVSTRRIPDYRDLDSDNDNINDVREYFATTVTADPDANGDGIVGDASTLDADKDGILDVTIGSINIDGSATFGDANDNAPANTDANTEGTIKIPDYRDLDSDNDAINDVREYFAINVTANPDADGNGIIGDNTGIVFTDTDADGILEFTIGTTPSDQAIGTFGDNEGDTATGLRPANTDVLTEGTIKIPDYRDLDSDNDAINDVREYFGVTFVTNPDTDGNGIVGNASNADTDNDGILDVTGGDNFVGFGDNADELPHNTDGITETATFLIPDFRDLDSDNDAINDVREYFPVTLDENPDADGNGIVGNASNTDADNDGILDITLGTILVDNNLANFGDNADAVPTNTDASTEDAATMIIPDYRDLDSDNDGIPDVREYFPVTNTADPDTNGDAMVGSGTFTDTDGDGILNITIGATNVDNNTNFGDATDALPNNTDILVEPVIIPDYRDLDSDNDGITDVREYFGILTGNPDADANAIVGNASNADADRDGLLDVSFGTGINTVAVDGITSQFGDNGINANGQENYNTDSSKEGTIKIPDYRDLDSDQDAINDVIEYHAPAATSPDPNQDGIVGGGTTTDNDNDGILSTADNLVGFGDSTDPLPHNTDATAEGTIKIPDFRDLDSDNDGINDVHEGFALTNADPDVNGDGIVGNNVTTDADNDGILDITIGTNIILLNGQPYNAIKVDGSSSFGDDNDVVTNTDTNSETTIKIPDFRDLDSDNDAINDVQEGFASSLNIDVNGDGIAGNSITTDADNDGILDVANVDDNTSAFGDVTSPEPTNTDAASPAETGTRIKIHDYRDLDSDNDAVNDIIEFYDTDASKFINGTEVNADPDNDALVGIAPIFVDADNDGIIDYNAGGTQIDNNLANYGDITQPNPVDTDSDATPNYRDLISNGTTRDLLASVDPGADANNDGVLDSEADLDFDGIVGVADGVGSLGGDAVDSDGDGIANFPDIDADNDGIPNSVEHNGTFGLDSDNDGVPNFLDLDSDNDGIADVIEAGGVDNDGDGRVDLAGGSPHTNANADAADNDNDGLIDIIDVAPAVLNTIPDATVSEMTNGTYGAPYPAAGTLDTDGDGVPNFIDLDSDNDGIYDLAEGYAEDTGTGTGSEDNDGILYYDALVNDSDFDGWINTYDGDNQNNGTPLSAGDGTPIVRTSSSTPGDSPIVGTGNYTGNGNVNDGDKRPNFLDLDSDNDGINDVREVTLEGLEGTSPNGLAGNNTTLTLGGGTVNTKGVPINASSEPISVSTLFLRDTDKDSRYDFLDLDSDNDGINDVREYFGNDGNYDPNGDGIVGDNTFTDADFDGILAGTITLYSGSPSANNDSAPTAFAESTDAAPNNADVNAEGTIKVPDFRDLDSDNDGINDVREYFGVTITADVDSNNDGVVGAAGGTDTDGDGILNVTIGSVNIDNGTAGFGENTTADGIPANTDGTTESANIKIPDFRDLDSDNDGINDVREYLSVTANLTTHNLDVNGDGYIGNAVTTDIDEDGILDVSFGTGATLVRNDGVVITFGDDNDQAPANTDSDTEPTIKIPDYRDLDSDNDGINDVREYFPVTNTGNPDADGNGIVGNASTTDTDNDGILEVVIGGVDIDGSTAAGGGDAGDAQPYNTDDAKEGNGTATEIDLPDFRDLDSDNDGINDVREYAPLSNANPDTNNDGFVGDTPFTDVDNDGILAPADGDDNTYADNTDNVPNNTDELKEGAIKIPDYRDLDADNDGIVDVREYFPVTNTTNPDTDGDGIVGNASVTDADNDGILDVVIGTSNVDNFVGFGDAGGANGEFAPTNTDETKEGTTKIPDFRDLDSDNDGINDVREYFGLLTGDSDPNHDGIVGDNVTTDNDNDGLLEVTFGTGANQVNIDGINTQFGDNGINGNAQENYNTDNLKEGAIKIPDYRDLDSDNDGINDVREFFPLTLTDNPDTDGDGIVGNASTTDADNDGILDIDLTTTSGTLKVDNSTSFGDAGGANGETYPYNTDETKEGTTKIPDFRDLDSDNDGINDVREYFSLATSADPDTDGDGIVGNASTSDTDNDGILNVIIGSINVDNSSSFGDASDATPANTDNPSETTIKIPDYRDLDSDNDGINDVREYFGVLVAADPDANGDGIVGNASTSDTDNDGILNVTIGSINIDNAATFGDATDALPANTDDNTETNAKIPDFRDLDSDNDGINDVREYANLTATNPDANNDAFADGITGGGTDPNDDDSDGIRDIADADNANYGDNADTQPQNTDTATEGTTKIPDFRDLDSDNDGINDVRENVRNSDGNFDTDNDAIADGVAGGDPEDDDFDGIRDTADADDTNIGETATADTPPTNTDEAVEGAVKIPDYRDLDSDNDGINDVREFFPVTVTANPDTDGNAIVGNASTTDTDNDGILNVVIGTINVDNFVGFGDAGGVNGETTPTNTDELKEGAVKIPDYRDLDSDNDGINDVREYFNVNITDNPDVDGNGIVGNASTTDADNDGILDVTIGTFNVDNSGTYGDNTDAIPYNTEDNVEGDGSVNEIDIPDYRDLDSDNDGINDVRENTLTDTDGNGDAIVGNATTVDNDEDGILDVTDGNTTLFGDASDTPPVNTDEAFEPATAKIPDYRDLDSDNDSMNDVVENFDTDGNGLLTAGEVLSDEDGDGIIGNNFFIDADNDGILDVVLTTPVAHTVDNSATFGDATDPTPQNPDADGSPSFRDVDSNNNATFDIAELGGFDTGADTNNDGVIDIAFNADGDLDGIVNIADGLPTEFKDLADADNDGISDNVDIDADNDGIPDQVEGGATPDKDGDGIPNYLDLDSDNDGIPDVIEAGGVDKDGDGKADFENAADPTNANTADADNDGLIDVIDIQVGTTNTELEVTANISKITANPAAGYYAATLKSANALDKDQDGVPDYLDIDSDNDGLFDVTEWGGTDVAENAGAGNGRLDFTAPFSSADTDRNGWIDGLTGVNSPLRSSAASASNAAPVGFLSTSSGFTNDGDNIPNFRDLDSDNDGINDVREAGLPDPDNNGLIGTGATTAITGLDADGKATGATSIRPNTDGDLRPDVIDLDSDNDGINDVRENTNTTTNYDTNNDGLVDGADTDNDGIRDLADADNTAFGEIGTADTPPHNTDSDNVADYLDLDSDDDGINDVRENLNNGLNYDTNNDGVVDVTTDADNDGIRDLADADNTAFGEIATADTPPHNTDNDNVPDYRDLDSDNDGILDVRENLLNTPDANSNGNIDIDDNNDGRVDGNDDDNDGIKNEADGDDAARGEIATADVPPVNTDAGVETTAIPDYRDLDSDNDAINDAREAEVVSLDLNGNALIGNVSVTFNANGIATGTLNKPIDTDADGIPDFRDLDSDDDGINDVREYIAFNVADIDTNNDAYADGTDTDNDGIRSSADALNGFGESDGADANPSNFDGDTFSGNPVFDFRDLDTDNDGILDIREGTTANFTDANNDGRVDGADTDTDGIKDEADTQTATRGENNDNLPHNTDVSAEPATKLPDFRDLDSDNDGINDATEATLAGLDGTSPNGLAGNDVLPLTINNNGLVAGFVTNAPRNSDNDNVPDYRDLDSDNDAINDIREASNQANNISASDSNNSGMLDALDTSYADADNDGIADFTTVDATPATYGDATNPALPNTDGVDVPDFRDLDSDNDGINDVREYFPMHVSGTGVANPDANGDGFVGNTSDTDTDGDGIVNVNITGFGQVDANVGYGDNNDQQPNNTDSVDQPDFRDIDSDNDGIFDVRENVPSNANPDTNNSGRIDAADAGSPVDTDNDGILSVADGNTASIGDSADPLPINTDGDKSATLIIPDFRDLDSDNDGIPDITEAGGATAGFNADGNSNGTVSNVLDTDGDGLSDAFDPDNGGTLLTIPDTDTDLQPNFRDKDSDNDSSPDHIEGYDDNEDGDALNDLKNRGVNFGTGSGLYSSPIYPATDVNANGIPDWLDDTDADGVPNFLDPDSPFYFDHDNDGLVDLFDVDISTAIGYGKNFGANPLPLISPTDAQPDNNSNGIPNYLDNTNTISLPITLLSFEAKAINQQAVLTWITTNELNTSHFEVERSTDLQNFVKIGQVDAKGGLASAIHTYQWIDANPIKGINYYRFKQVDIDGKFEYSVVKALEFAEISDIVFGLYPNPAQEYVKISFQEQQESELIYQLYDIQGKLQVTQKVASKVGDNLIELDIKHLATGQYQIILIKDGKVQVLRFIKQ